MSCNVRTVFSCQKGLYYHILPGTVYWAFSSPIVGGKLLKVRLRMFKMITLYQENKVFSPRSGYDKVKNSVLWAIHSI